MKKRYTEEQIFRILKEGHGGKIAEICRRYGISEATSLIGGISMPIWG